MATETKIVLTAQDKTRGAVDSAKRNLAGIQAQASKLNAVMGTLAGAGGLGALAGGLSAGAFLGFVKGVTDSVDALNDFSDATGTSVENASALIDVAMRTGTAVESAETAVVKLNQALNTASDPNSSAAGALKAIGLSVEELKRLDPAQALLEVARALDKYADGGDKARLVQELLGKSARELAPYLKDLAEKGQLNATVTTEQAQEAEKFNKQLFELQTNAQNAARAIGMAIVPSLNSYIDRVKEALKVSGGYAEMLKLFASSSWADAAKMGLGLVDPKLGPNVAATRKELSGLADDLAKEQQRLADLQGRKYLNPVERDDLRTTEGNVARIQAKIEEAKKRHEFAQMLQRQAALEGTGGVLDARDARAQAGEAKPQVQFNPYHPPKSAKAKVDKEYDAELEMSRRTAEAYAATLGKLTDAQREAEESTLDLTPSQKALRDLMADPVWQSMPETWQQTAIAQTEAAVAAEKAAKATKEYEDRFKALMDASSGAQLEKQRQDMLLLADAFQKGRISADEFSDAAGTALGTLPKQAEEAADEMDQFMIQAARNIQDAFADFLFDPFKDGVSGMLKNFGQVIQRMIAQAVAADLGRRLFGEGVASGKAGADLGGWAKSALDWIGGLFKSADGNAFSASGPVAAFASGGAFGNGGILTQPTLFRFADGGAFRTGVAGEAGPEGALPLQRMRNGKLGVSAAGMGQGGGDMHIHITVPPGTPAEQRASLAQQARTALGAMKRAGRYG